MQRYLRKVFRIRASDSPNVRLAEAQIRAGQIPTDEILVSGVITWSEYQRRRQLWDAVRQSVGLDASFWEGTDALLFPPEWLNRSELAALPLIGIPRKADAIGIDPAEGGDETSWIAIDRLGVIEQISKKTPDTSIVPGETIAFGKKHGVNAENWVFDRGGGGYEHVCTLRSQGYNARSIGFGEAVTEAPSYVPKFDKLAAKVEQHEEKYTHVNRRAEMYFNLRHLIDPARELEGKKIFAIPADYTELRRQLAPIPLTYDREGRHYILPKDKKSGSHEQCLKDLIGCSPDRADSLVLAIYGMVNPQKKLKLKIW